ncbi:uncharacterized protein LOC116805416 [Drosophila grimshawi]|uniref:uncharacterized protein LOC116805416 n=1 Tax=Drosophila grimshawi TaxID=7222 RepID=UPI000C86E5D8|nr:uncharacterized protein LOC116805416 [Drosophila grimshawi]
MWRLCCLLLFLTSGYFLLTNGQPKNISQNVGITLSAPSLQVPAAIVFGNPRPSYFSRKRLRLRDYEYKKDKRKRQRKRPHASTKTTIKKSVKQQILNQVNALKVETPKSMQQK